MKVALPVPGVEFVRINGADPPRLAAVCQQGRWSCEIYFWKDRNSMITNVVPTDSALPSDLRRQIVAAVDDARDQLLADS